MSKHFFQHEMNCLLIKVNLHFHLHFHVIKDKTTHLFANYQNILNDYHSAL